MYGLEFAPHNSLVAVMMERRKELEDEVPEDEHLILVKVRHPTEGDVSRWFAITGTFANVHQVVGSFANSSVVSLRACLQWNISTIPMERIEEAELETVVGRRS